MTVILEPEDRFLAAWDLWLGGGYTGVVTKGQWKDSALLELPGSFTVVDMGVQAGWNHTGTHTLTARMCLLTHTHTPPPGLLPVAFLTGTLYCTFAGCHHWGKLGKGYQDLEYFSQLHVNLQVYWWKSYACTSQTFSSHSHWGRACTYYYLFSKYSLSFILLHTRAHTHTKKLRSVKWSM